jgi:nucleotide-binding universal stress UspA family protein
VDIESRYRDAAYKLQDAIPKEALLWCTAATVVRCGNAAKEILTYAENHKIDLICIGARGTGFDLNKLFGSTIEHVLCRADCPVLVARPAVAKATSARAA